MIELDRPRRRVLLFLGLAFLFGLGLASGFDLPLDKRGAVVAQTALPTRQDVRPVAELSESFIAISDAVTPAVVRIQSERSGLNALAGNPFRDFYDAPQPQGVPQLSGGTGFIVSPDGYILTNNHVIDGAARISVMLVDKRVYEARIVGRDPTTDVAVIKIDASRLPTVRLGNSDQARVGEWVLAIGNPGFGETSTLDFTVTSGIVSAKGRPLDIINRELQATGNTAASYAIEDFIQTDAVINPGNSGGPLVNIRGEVIGINTAIASGTGYYQGYGFAIPINLAQRVMLDLIDHGHVRRALLSISITNVSSEDAEVYGLEEIAGVLVEDFADDSPAQESGMQRGDVIVSVNGERVDRVGQLQRLVAQQQPGDHVMLGVVRAGDRHEYRVRLVQAPIASADASEPEPDVGHEIGIRVTQITASIARELGLADAGGIVVSDVAPMSPAFRKDVRRGDRILSINGREPRNAREVETVLRGLRPGQIVSLLLQSAADGRTRIANIRAP